MYLQESLWSCCESSFLPLLDPLASPAVKRLREALLRGETRHRVLRQRRHPTRRNQSDSIVPLRTETRWLRSFDLLIFDEDCCSEWIWRSYWRMAFWWSGRTTLPGHGPSSTKIPKEGRYRCSSGLGTSRARCRRLRRMIWCCPIRGR